MNRAQTLKKIEELKRLKHEKLVLYDNYRRENLLEFFTTKSMPANPLQKELLEVYLDPRYKIFTYTGSNRIGKCLTYQTLIDTPDGEIAIGQLFENQEPFDVYSWDGEKKVVARASAPFKKPGLHDCYKVTMSDGRWVEAADHHRILTSHGWLSMQDVLSSYYQSPVGSSLGFCPLAHALDEGRLSQKQLDYQGRYFGNFHQYDEQPLLDGGSVQVYSRPQGDVQQHDVVSYNMDGQAYKDTSTQKLESAPPTNSDDPHQIGDLFFDTLCCTGGRTLIPFLPVYQLSQLPCNVGAFEPQLDFLTARHQLPVYDSCDDTSLKVIGENQIECITPITSCQQEVYDFSVEKYKNYFAGGLIHHNTTIGVIIAFATMFGEWPWDHTRLPFKHAEPRKVRYVGQDWEKHVNQVLIPALKKWWPKTRKVKIKKNTLGVEAFWVDERTKSSLEIMSNKQDSELHEGWEGDLIIYDEPPKRNIRVANARGLVDREGRELFCMTLLKEAWVDREVIKARNDDGTPDTTVFNINGDIYSNVGFGITLAGVEQFAKTLTDDEKSARIHGKPSYLSGLVYPQFKRKIHLKEPFSIPTDWIVDIAIDVHPREKQAILFIATDPRDYKWVFHEVWGHGDGDWIGHEIIRYIIAHALRIGRIIIDPLAKGDSNNPNTTFDRIDGVLSNHGYYADVATKDKQSGIIEVRNHLKGPNNEPSIFFFDTLRRTVWEIEGYMFDEDTQKPCVIGSTIIDTPFGQMPIKDLVGQESWVYSYSNKFGRLNVNKAKNIRKTREKAEIWRLSMDRGVLFATPDHLIMLRDGTYKQLQNLKPYDSLMPLYRTIGVDGYPRINPNDHRSKHGEKYPGEHRFVYECVYGEIPEDKEIHHIDGNYLNHIPENLQPVTAAEHQQIHIDRGVADIICINCGKIFTQNKTWQKHCSGECRKKYNEKRREDLGRVIKNCVYCGRQFQTIGNQVYCSVTCRQRAYRERRKSLPSYNHKVLSVNFYGYEDVYDMEVENDHNFIAEGVVVHNCDKDDHFCENLYRLCNLDTRWSEPDWDEDEDEVWERRTANKVTGY